MTRRFPIAGYAASVVEVYADEVIDWSDEPEMAAVVNAYRAGGPYTSADQPRVLVVAHDAAFAVADGLCDLVNGEDDMADDKARTDPESARYHRAGARGLRTVRSKVLDFAEAARTLTGA